MTKLVRDLLEALSCDILFRAAYSSDLTPSDHHLFASMDRELAKQRFGSYEDVKKWLGEWFAAKRKIFIDFFYFISQISRRWAMEHTLNKALFIILRI